MNERAEHTAGAAHHPSIGELFYPGVNFLLFVALMGYFLRGPIREFFRARTARLREALDTGARARREAEALRTQLARDVENLPALRERLRADLRATAERELQGLLESGRGAASRVREDARLVAEQEFMAAREALRAEVIGEAVRQATALVRGAIRTEDHERFVHEFVASAGAAS
jgi:F0F1-type ATP synthase membrane subunit b/b'